jgi:predicted NBD/HSP70 family sugar kinase
MVATIMVGTNLGSIPATLRRANERAIVGLLLRLGTASRAELAKAAGLSQPTIGKITSELLEQGLLRELDDEDAGAGGPPARVGRPGKKIRLDNEKPRFLAIEFDVKETRLAALPIATREEDAWEESFPTGDSPVAWKRLLKRAAARFGQHELWGAMVSAPGVIDEPQGRVLFSPNLHWAEQVSLTDWVQESTGLPARLVQEIRALALGHLAANPHVQDFLLVDFGQGVGGAMVKDGKLYQNPLPLNGELGHTPILGNARLCGCGARGCVETLMSRRGLLQSFAAAHPGKPADWPALVRHLSQEEVPEWLAGSLAAMGAVVAGALNLLGLRRVVLTGFLSELPESVTEHLAGAIRSGAMWARFGEVMCERAPRRRAAGLAGVGLDRLLVPVAHQEGWRSLSLTKD